MLNGRLLGCIKKRTRTNVQMIEEKSTMTGLGKKQSGSFCCRIIRSRLIKLTSISKQQVKIYVALFLCMVGERTINNDYNNYSLVL